MINKKMILECLTQDEEAFTQIVEYFGLAPEIDITSTEIEELLAEMLEEGLIVIDFSWKTENNEHPYLLTEKGRKEFERFQNKYN